MQNTVPNNLFSNIRAFPIDLRTQLERAQDECESLTTSAEPSLPEHRVAQTVRALSSWASEYIPVLNAASEYVAKVVGINNNLMKAKREELADISSNPRPGVNFNQLSIASETHRRSLIELYEGFYTDIARLNQQMATKHQDLTNKLRLTNLRSFEENAKLFEEVILAGIVSSWNFARRAHLVLEGVDWDKAQVLREHMLNEHPAIERHIAPLT
jgi:hypothetical protein